MDDLRHDRFRDLGDNSPWSRLSRQTTPAGSKRIVNVGFRSSIFRELALRSEDADTSTVHNEGRLTTDDIRASPRFVGYIFSMIAASVLLVSVVQFYRQDALVQEELPEVDNDIFFVTTGGFLVYRWKLWGAMYAGSIGVGLSLSIILAHFDTIFLPRLWMHVFKDGSLIERNMILLLMAFWAAALHICTSSLSIGEQEANVYFTTWIGKLIVTTQNNRHSFASYTIFFCIAFGSVGFNYGVWRESAGLPSFSDEVNLFHRETTYNWIWIGFFSAVFAGSATDRYRNRDDIELIWRGEVLELQADNWKLVLAIVWTEVTVCVLSVILNESFIDAWYLPVTIRRSGVRYACGWRQLEGLIMLAGVGAKCWFIVGKSNSFFPSNLSFSVSCLV